MKQVEGDKHGRFVYSHIDLVERELNDVLLTILEPRLI